MKSYNNSNNILKKNNILTGTRADFGKIKSLISFWMFMPVLRFLFLLPECTCKKNMVILDRD
jgi:hypothetical protein